MTPVFDVSVLVVAARDPARLRHCLDAVQAQADGLTVELVVVLNAAEDGMAEAAGDARIVVSDVPLGFAGGANLAAAGATGRLLYLLHDDALVRPGALRALVEALDAEPRAGAAGSLLLDGTPGGSAGAHLFRDGRTAPRPADGRDVVAVDYCPSASVLVRAEAWHAVGGLDEDLHPAQFVDVDLAMRLRAAGWLVVCAPGSVVEHARGGTSSPALKRVAWARNHARFVARWADDLPWQAPFGDTEAAEQATHARAEAVLATAPRSGTRPPGPPDVAGAQRPALRREAGFRAALVAELERLEDLAAGLQPLREELARIDAAHAQAAADAAALRRDREVLRADVAARDGRIAELEAALTACRRRGWRGVLSRS